MKQKLLKLLWWFLGVAIIAAAGIFAWRKFGPADKPAVQYDTVKVERGNVVSRVTATGTLSALVTVQVGSQVSGRIQALYADFNSPVKKGQKLAKLDPQSFQASVAQANAQLISARGNRAKVEAQAANTKAQYERAKQLAEKKLIAESELDTAKANMLVSQADLLSTAGSIEVASANLKQARINLAYTDIVSPVDGIVISRAVDVGQTVAASLQAPTIFTIAEDLRKMQVDTSVAEADVGKLEPQMPATFTVDAFPNIQFKGIVRQIRNAPVTVQNVVTYVTVIDVDNPDLKLRPGMTATVTFISANRENVIRVPNAALRWKPAADAAAAGSSGRPMGSGRRFREGGGPPASASGDVPALAGSGQGPAGSASADTATAPATPGRGRGRDGSGGASDRKTVYVMRDGKPTRIPVRVGISDGSYTEIVDGPLQEGDELITGSSDGGGASTSGARPGGQANPMGGMRRIL
ncbi:MAG TPA: efflux RND transporter periplasmic adaptor subunit [Polyangiaceae bacterium]|nr:efflux RND transporter periplasmic adaptor subunit [Polyangiaceae bacterium]